jgi:hypothetical protein
MECPKSPGKTVKVQAFQPETAQLVQMPANVQAFKAIASVFAIVRWKRCTFAGILRRKLVWAVKACKNAGISQLPERNASPSHMESDGEPCLSKEK